MKSVFKSSIFGILAAAGSLTMFAEPYNGPAITMFYPAKANPENGVAVQDLKDTASAYVYFETGSKVTEAKALVVQNGETLGTCVYSNAAGGSTATMKPSAAENQEVMGSVNAGQFTLYFYGVTWKDGADVLNWEDIDSPIEDVTYNRPAQSATIVSESGFEDNKMISYYPADGEAGVKKIVFSKPVVQGNPRVSFIYGYGDFPFETPLEYSQSADGLELTIDLRGKCYNVDALAPGATFTDVDGRPLPNPSTINLAIEGLLCTDGSTVMTASHGVTLNGRAYYSWDYQDITLPNPVIAGAEFYAAADPEMRYMNINPATDMMDLTVNNASSLLSTDMVLTVGDLREVIVDADIQKDGEVYTVALPASIIAAGSENLVITLENFTMASEDGAEHVIKPYNFNKTADEKFNVAQVKQLEAGSDVVLVTENLKITYSSHETMYTFGEDATGGLQFVTEDETVLPFEQGIQLRGRIVGKYMGDDMFKVDMENSEFTTEEADVRFGKTVYGLAELTRKENNCCLITLMMNDELSYEDDGMGTLMVTDVDNYMVAVPTDFIGGYDWPDEGLISVTGIAGTMFGMNVLIVRTTDDIDSSQSGITNATLDQEKKVIYNLHGMKVDTPTKGIYIVNGKKVIL